MGISTFDFFGNKNLCPYISCRVVTSNFRLCDAMYRIPANKVFYAQFDKETILRAFKIEKVYYGTDNIFLLVNIAGVGLKYIPYAHENDRVITRLIFASPKDYKENKPCYIWDGDKAFSFVEYVEKLGTLKTYGNNGYAYIERYGWIDNTCKSRTCNFLTTYTFENGVKIDFFDDSDKEFPYTTEKECLKQNRVEVFNFEDEVEPTRVEVEIIRTKRFVSAPNKPVDVETATKLGKFYGENSTKEGERYKVYVNGELEYES